MTIWRTIFLNSINELDKSNFGCHWTKDEFYHLSMEFIYNDISERGRHGNIQFLFKVEIDVNHVDRLSTIKK
ncbi:hypothetical protein Lupro_11800 [Lutibacter profundi]|uniref:Uncharacterized protein n=1 Tax=Lutibacter profundi TaxID=1622118 RepID=A0A120IEJ8_9FLAO|nr:hypothetical protein [Lutibacter profundi]AMC11906.1 hypothetical protein Lupro_11800 [Lutibacter profundi]